VLSMYDRLQTVEGFQTHTRGRCLGRGGMTRVTFLRLSNSSGGFAGPSGPFSASLAPSGGLHQTTRSAGST
jgi:hypothetical protein